MGANVLSEFFKSQQDRERLRQVEQLRRKGHNFIKVRYNGSTIPKIDSEGLVYNVRIHGLKDVEAFEKTDISTGKTEWQTRPGSRALHFRQSPTGDIETDVWDDPDDYNRHFLSTHPELEVVDPVLARKIEELKGKPFKAELSEEEMLEREIAAKQKELDNLKKVRGDTPKKKLAIPPEKIYRGGRKKGSKNKKKRAVNGINKSTPSLDSPGMPRVATGGNGEGDTAPIQSGTPDSQHSGEGAEPNI